MGKCYRVEPRTVIPGQFVKVPDQLDAFEEQIDLFVVIESRTEYAISFDGGRHKPGWLRINQYYLTEEQADTVARGQHKLHCKVATCDWNE